MPPASGVVVLFTGLPAAGKSTLSEAVLGMLQPRCNRPIHLLDGDALRREMSSDLGYARGDRDQHMQRVGSRAAELVRSDGVVLCALIAPYEAARRALRQCVETHGAFVLVHVSTPLAICEQRDPKGLYARARAGSLPHFTGVSDPYEAPADADLTIDTASMTAEQAGRTVVDYLRQRGLIELA